MIKEEIKPVAGVLSLQKIYLLFRDWAPWLLGLQIAACVAIAAMSSYSWMMYVRDDFFYYLVVAQNFAAGHGSTFNGIVSTNGYHPLWMLVLAAFSVFTAKGTAILVFVGAVCLAASVACFLWGREILELSGVETTISAPLALWIAVFCCRRFYTGMEVVLATPLAFLLTLRVLKGRCMATARSAFWTGIICSLLILSRLDAGFLVGLLGVGLLLDRDYRQQLSPRRIASFALGLVPFLVYLVVNKVKFGLLLPVSGVAKQLKPHTQFSWVTWKEVLPSNIDKEHLQVAFILFSTAVILFNFRKLQRAQRTVFPAVVLFPVVYFTVLSFLSDWRPNDWYGYVERPALCISLAFWFSRDRLGRVSRWAALPAIAIAASVFALAGNTWNAQDDHRFEDSVALHHFATGHPGIYAMGDFGGEPGYVLGDPMIQTEGLMMDRHFLERIKRQENLISVLSAYHARYYIANAREGYTGCFHAVEPLRGGPASPKMRAEFCQKPVADVHHQEGNDFVIFDLQPQ